MNSAITVRNLDKDFPLDGQNVRVLFDINAEIRMGQLTMLIGPSGCGKTTLVSILSGILSLTNGDVEILGRSLKMLNDSQKVLFRRKNIGFIFQQYNLLPALSVIENAAIPLFCAGVEKKQALQHAFTVLKGIGMENHVDKFPRQLSGGQQQRVAIARALVHNPKIIVCDEPTAALDGQTGKSVMEILKKISNDKNRVVLIVTHDDRTYGFADRVLEMADGRIIGDFKAKEFINRE